MKTMKLLMGAAALVLVGCAHDRHYVRYHDRYGTSLDTGFADKDKPYWPKIASTEARS